MTKADIVEVISEKLPLTKKDIARVLDLFFEIIKEGLKSESRQYVHLSGNVEDAILIGKRRTTNPTILKINTEIAKKEGITFYKSGDLYLTDFIPPRYISELEERDK